MCLVLDGYVNFENYDADLSFAMNKQKTCIRTFKQSGTVYGQWQQADCANEEQFVCQFRTHMRFVVLVEYTEHFLCKY